MEAKLAIIIPCYNQGQYVLPTLIYSLLSQTNGGFRAFVGNDGPSTDGTREFMEGIIDKYPKNFVYFENQKRMNDWGHSQRIAGMNMCTESHIFFCNADNLLVKDFVRQVTVEIIQKDPDLITFPILHSYFKYTVFPGHEFKICQSDFINWACRTSMAREVGIKKEEIAADGHFCTDWRKKYGNNFTQVKLNSVLAVHQ